MSETESVTAQPRPHGESLWDNLEELELHEPLLEGSPGNARREAAIASVREGLAGRGRGGDPEYARALELLGVLTPTSNYGVWCKLRDELARLGDGAARVVGPECELVRTDTLRGIKSDTELVPALHEECMRFLEDHESWLSDFERYLVDMMRHVGAGARGGEGVRRYIVGMARFNSGVDDRLVLRVILAVYVEPGTYEGALSVCEDIVGFGGEDRAKMAGSTLVEGVIDGILSRLSESYDPARDDVMVQRCIDILMARSSNLGLNQRPGRGTRLRQASRLALNVLARRSLHTSGEIDEWLRQRHRTSHEFLDRGGKRIGDMLEADADLAEGVLAHMAHDELERAGGRPREPHGVLDELDRLIRRMRERGIDEGEELGGWRRAMRGDALWGALPELRVYLRLRLAGLDVEPRPPAGDGARLSLRVGDCYMVAPPPEDGMLLSRRQLDDASLVEGALGGIMGGGRPGHVGDRATMLFMDCSRRAFGSRELRGRLASSIAARPQLAGVLLALYEDGGYRSEFVENPGAGRRVPPTTVDMIAGALGARV